MGRWRLILILFAIFFVQQLPIVANWGMDLPLVFVILAGLRATPTKAAGWGFLLGLAQDTLSASWIGPNTVAKTLTGLLCAYFHRRIYREKVLTQTFLVMVATLFHQGLVWLIKLWDGSAPSWDQSLWICWKALVGTTAMGILASLLLVRFRRRRYDPATA